MTLANLPKAAERIAQAIRDQEKIVIYGDYDVDGITPPRSSGTRSKTLGGEVSFYIPHRIEEGYGLNSEAIAQICSEGAKVIVSSTAASPRSSRRRSRASAGGFDHYGSS